MIRCIRLSPGLWVAYASNQTKWTVYINVTPCQGIPCSCGSWCIGTHHPSLLVYLAEAMSHALTINELCFQLGQGQKLTGAIWYQNTVLPRKNILGQKQLLG